MARTAKNINLSNRTARLSLPEKRKHWQNIGIGLSLAYRRAKTTSSWCVRILVGDVQKESVFAEADDFKDSNAETVLTYKQAVERAVVIQNGELLLKADYTVTQAMTDYQEWYALNGNRGIGGKNVKGQQGTIDHHITPRLGKVKLVDLTTKMIRKWHNDIAKSKAIARGKEAKEFKPQQRKSTANRVLTVLRSGLNHAFNEGMIDSDVAWRRVKPFANVDNAKIRYLSKDESARFINACSGVLRPLAQAGLMTGARYGELCALKASAFGNDSLHIESSKSGKARYIPLTDDGVAFFDRACAGKDGDEFVFMFNGKPWAKSNQTRPVKEACMAAKITPPIGFHILRHTYASHLVMSGTPLEVVSHVLGHADMRTTLKYYAHLAPSYVADSVRANMPTLGEVVPDNVVAIQGKVP